MIKTLMRFGYVFSLSICLLLLGACKQSALSPTLTWYVYNQDISEHPQLSYKLVQRAGIPMLIKAWGYEAEFELTTTDPNTQESNNTRTPFIRLGPQFHLLEKREVDTEIQITLTAINFTKNAQISVEAYELSEADKASRQQINAYRLISEATESTKSEKTDIWRERIRKLQKASQILNNLGQDEIRMWVESYENYFTYFPLYQYNEAIAKSKKLEKEAGHHGLADIELLALQIQGQALIERNLTDTEAVVRKKHLEAQSIFDRALMIANQLGFEFEQAWIINSKGTGFFYAGDQTKALEENYQAEIMAANLLDNFLLTTVRSNIVSAYVESGEIKGAIDVLTKIAESISIKNNPSRIALAYVEIAKLHSVLYEFPQAINGLSTALNFFEKIGDHESQGRTLFSLASAYFEIGRSTHSINLLSLALLEFESANYGRGLYDVHGKLANIYRHLGQFNDVSQHRDEQLKYLANDQERASTIFESAKDLYIQERFSDSKQRFIQGQKLMLATKRENLAIISSLYLCLIEYRFESSDNHCLANFQRSALTDIQSISNIRRKLEGKFLWAQLNLKANRQNEAFTVLDELVNDIRFYRKSLPGVLGAWFWENNKKIFEVYLKVSADRHSDLSESAFESLMAIQKIKSINSPKKEYEATAQTNNDDLKTAKAIRTLIANIESGKTKLSNVDLSNQLDSLILRTSNDSSQVDEEINSRWLQDALTSLPENSALLTICSFGDEVYVWIANKEEITLEKLAQNFDVNSALSKVMENIRNQGSTRIRSELENLGRSLLQPVMAHLPETIFFLPLGNFNGFPLEALIVEGQYLIEQHQVINISSLDFLKSISNSRFLEVDTNQIFVAGNQFFNDSLVMDLPGTSTELANIAKIFNESDIHFATGGDLSTDTFSGPEIKKADIIHIASHAVLDVNYPDLSRIYLNTGSSRQPNAAEAILAPSDIRSGHYQADLVFLSACQTSGLNKFAFDSNLGFVSEFIISGSSAVIASLWPISDSETAVLVKNFYSALKQNVNLAHSLTNTKRAYIQNNPSNRVAVWAAFQLFI